MQPRPWVTISLKYNLILSASRPTTPISWLHSYLLRACYILFLLALIKPISRQRVKMMKLFIMYIIFIWYISQAMENAQRQYSRDSSKQFKKTSTVTCNSTESIRVSWVNLVTYKLGIYRMSFTLVTFHLKIRQSEICFLSSVYR
jgi:hypothetical protein